MSKDNKSLGQFNLTDIPSAARGMPQIEVNFDIDANGILHVSAKDKATGKENKITIKANSGLSDEEIENMVKDAEAHAEDDKKARELVDVRNQCDSLIHSVRKTLSENEDKVSEEEKTNIENAAKEAEEALKNGDKDDIEAKSQALSALAQSLAEKMYAEQAQETSTEGSQNGTPEEEGDVVDAEFEEVKDDKKDS
jgi:molecular chaperone DnaK